MYVIIMWRLKGNLMNYKKVALKGLVTYED
jgi:hypothetical protein